MDKKALPGKIGLDHFQIGQEVEFYGKKYTIHSIGGGMYPLTLKRGKKTFECVNQMNLSIVKIIK